MNFQEILNIENSMCSKEYENRNYFQPMFNEYLEKEQAKKSAKENPFVYFYEDVIDKDLLLDFERILGDKPFKNASEDALSCLNICIEFRKLSAYSVNSWLQNALKFIDHIVLHYIQDYCREKPKKYPETGIERSRYKHLMDKTGDIAIAGEKLNKLYDLRNSFEHRTKTNSDGKQELLSPQRGKARWTVGKIYPQALDKMLNVYKKIGEELFINNTQK